MPNRSLGDNKNNLVPQRKRLFLVDSYGFIFRAYHARARTGAPPMRTKSGLMTEAVFIFVNMIRRVLKNHKPDYMAAIFEGGGQTFREAEFADYKANRAETPPDLIEQIPYVQRVLEALSIPVLKYPGFEADDVIGTIAKTAVDDHRLDVVIVSSDKDMLQLVNEHVTMLNPMKDDFVYNVIQTEVFMGVKPSQVADLLALKGDSVDNIPGAPGIGDKGAKDIILKFGSVEAALDRAAEVERKMYRESLQNNRAQIELSKRLATIACDVPIEFNLQAAQCGPPNVDQLKELYKELEFYSLIKELGASEDKRERDYAVIETADQAQAYAATIPDGEVVAMVISPATLLEPVRAGISFAEAEGRSMDLDLAIEAGLLEKVNTTHDLKAAILLAPQANCKDDVRLLDFLVTADPSNGTLSALTEKYLDRKLEAGLEQQADCVRTLAIQLKSQLKPELRKVYEEIDLPLSPVLADMERIGIRIDQSELGRLSTRMDEEIQKLSADIYAISGRTFNINSPQQLGKVLFEDMGLPTPFKYGKGKQISTAADVLEGLAEEHPIATKVLEFRQMAKLKGTYADALPSLIRPETGRVHTTFNQTGAATGRLSSSNPNLQNIPIRTELGREIRRAFVPRDGWQLVVADYSQIELRLLAHMSGDKLLVEAFRNGEDIHTRTAAEVLGVPPLMVTPDMRRSAKAVNFGIVYGQTSFGLSQTLGIDRREADRYIKSYFERYSGVRTFIDRTIAEVRESGVARTLHGRLRPIPDMHSRNPSARGFAERTAVNTPLQGTASDLIKIAMIRLSAKLKAYETRMLLQVHDELVLESPPHEVDEIRHLVKHEMESVYPLNVPLLVDTGAGVNWRDAK